MKRTAGLLAGVVLGALALTGCGDLIHSGEVIEKDDYRQLGRVAYSNALKLRDCVTRNEKGQCRTSWITVDDETYNSTDVGDWHQSTPGHDPNVIG